jgi:hypothetical protein
MNLKIILIAAFGAAMLELIYWYELRKRLENRRYRKLLRSWAYWFVIGSFVVGSGVATWIWYGMEPAGKMSQDPRDYFLVGAALPLLLKGAVRALGSKGSPNLGAGKNREEAGAWRRVWEDYLQTRPIRQEVSS